MWPILAKIAKVLLIMVYGMAAMVTISGIMISLLMKDFWNAALIVSSLGVLFLGLHLRKYTK